GSVDASTQSADAGPPMSDAAAIARTPNQDVAASDSAPRPPAADQLETDPCDVQEGTLTNEGLIRQSSRVEGYLRGRDPGEDAYYAHAHLARRLARERERRMRQGHVWLGADISAVPPRLYRLAPGSTPTQALVLPADVETERGLPVAIEGSILTPTQF